MKGIRKCLSAFLHGGDVINDPYFEDFGRLLFPVDRSVSEDMTLEEISSGSVYVWYNDIDPDKTVEIIQSLHDHAAAGEIDRAGGA